MSALTFCNPASQIRGNMFYQYPDKRPLLRDPFAYTSKRRARDMLNIQDMVSKPNRFGQTVVSIPSHHEYPEATQDQGIVMSGAGVASGDYNPQEAQQGSGMTDVVTALKLLKEGGKLAYNLYGSDTATKVKNFLQNTDNPYAREQYSGERHILLPTRYGATLANYAG